MVKVKLKRVKILISTLYLALVNEETSLKKKISKTGFFQEYFPIGFIQLKYWR